MKAKVTIEVDTDSGDYELRFQNLSKPGEPMDAGKIMEMVRRALNQVAGRVEVEGDTH